MLQPNHSNHIEQLNVYTRMVQPNPYTRMKHSNPYNLQPAGVAEAMGYGLSLIHI